MTLDLSSHLDQTVADHASPLNCTYDDYRHQEQQMKSLLILLTFVFCTYLPRVSAFDHQDPTTQEQSITEQVPDPLYADGSDGADVRAMVSAWRVFATTCGLEGSELDMENYWFTIEVTRIHRVIAIYPKPRAETRDVPLEDLPTDEWNWGTEGTFWVNKATFEVDRKFVLPPRPDRG